MVDSKPTTAYSIRQQQGESATPTIARTGAIMKITSYSQFKFIRANFQTPIEDVKEQYKKLIKRLHPDLGGSTEDMARLNVEYDFCKCHNFNVHKSQTGNVYTDETQERPTEVDERFTEIIEALLHMEGVGIEICGSFLWLDGNTYAHKDGIKALGFRWASKKRRWFLAPKDWRKRGRRELSMEEIRNNYGSQRVAAGHAVKLALEG